MTPGELPAPGEVTRSPFLPQSLVDLFLRPRHFFAAHVALGRTPYVVLVVWSYGIASAIERAERELATWIDPSWRSFWFSALFWGAFGGAGLWLLGGWWYRVRLRWCGAREPDRRRARLAYAYSSFVLAAPTILWTLIQTASYPSYAEAAAADDVARVLLLVFPFWSVQTSFAAATTLFELAPLRARVWFQLLPACAYLLLYGLLRPGHSW